MVATNIAATLAKQGEAVTYLDCDVEEPNGHLFLKPEIEKEEELAKEPEKIEAKELETTLETAGELEEEGKAEPIQPPVTPMGKGELPIKKKKKLKKKKKIQERKSDDSAMKEQKIDKKVYDQKLQKEHETPEALPWNDGECVKCGESLKLHSEFCWNCGTKYKVRKK